MNQANKQKISVIIPVFNEKESIGKVLSDLPKDYLDKIIIVDNGSTDNSAGIAADHGNANKSRESQFKSYRNTGAF